MSRLFQNSLMDTSTVYKTAQTTKRVQLWLACKTTTKTTWYCVLSLACCKIVTKTHDSTTTRSTNRGMIIGTSRAIRRPVGYVRIWGWSATIDFFVKLKKIRYENNGILIKNFQTDILTEWRLSWLIGWLARGTIRRIRTWLLLLDWSTRCRWSVGIGPHYSAADSANWWVHTRRSRRRLPRRHTSWRRTGRSRSNESRIRLAGRWTQIRRRGSHRITL